MAAATFNWEDREEIVKHRELVADICEKDRGPQGI